MKAKVVNLMAAQAASLVILNEEEVSLHSAHLLERYCLCNKISCLSGPIRTAIVGLNPIQAVVAWGRGEMTQFFSFFICLFGLK